MAKAPTAWEDMNRGVNGWHENVKDGSQWENMPAPKKVKYNDTMEMYHFRNEYYQEYVKMING